MMHHPHRLLAVGLGGLAVLLTACSAGVRDSASQNAATTAPATTEAAPPVDPTTDAAAPGTDSGAADDSGSAPGAVCFAGTYSVRTIVGREAVDTDAGPAVPSGSGGSLRLTFTNSGGWTLSSDGSRPISLSISGISVSAAVDGRSEGVFTAIAGQYVFHEDRASGTVTFSTPVGTQHLPMTAIARALVPAARATITCGGDSVRLVSDSVELTLVPIGSSAGGGSGGSQPNPKPQPQPQPPSGGSGSGGAPIVIARAGMTGSYDCRGHSITIQTSTVNLHLIGTCPVLRINGSLNQVTVDATNSIIINGSNDKVVYHSGHPTISIAGVNSTATRG
jgi:hypothetical protein